MFIDVPKFEPWISFRSNGLMYYNTSLRHRKSLMMSKAFMTNAEKLEKRVRYVGVVTHGMIKRMKKAITLLIQSTPHNWVYNPISEKQVYHHLSFITLTVTESAEVRCAKFAHKKMLEPMLRVLRTRYGMKSYIWKCELQQNGTIHYHITSDLFIQHDSLRMEWNKICSKLGLLDRFESQYGHKNPNSTDIHAVQKVKNLEAYITKYITKEVASGKILCAKVWDCSKNLKKADYFKCHLDERTAEYIRQLQNSLLVKTSYFEHAIFLNFGTGDYYSYLKPEIIDSFFNHLKLIRSWENNENMTKTNEAKLNFYNASCTLKSTTNTGQRNGKLHIVDTCRRSSTKSQTILRL